MLYLSIISVLSIGMFIFSLTKSFTLPSNRKLRGCLFLLVGISTSVPIIHLAMLNNQEGMIPDQKFTQFILGGLTYIMGALIYISRIPEKHCPGTFCIWGSSHQIWHCLVITGIVFHYLASVQTYHERLNFSECPR